MHLCKDKEPDPEASRLDSLRKVIVKSCGFSPCKAGVGCAKLKGLSGFLKSCYKKRLVWNPFFLLACALMKNPANCLNIAQPYSELFWENSNLQ